MSPHSTPPLPTEILHYYRGCLEALAALRLSAAPSPMTATSVPPTREFFGMTIDEFEAAVRKLRAELDQQVVMMLVASFEAIYQADLRQRLARRRNGELSKALRRWWRSQRRKRHEWINFDSLLDAWKKTVHGHSRTLGRLRSLLLFRHWLAHGRYWADKSGLRNVDPLAAWQIGKAVFDALPGFPSLPVW